MKSKKLLKIEKRMDAGTEVEKAYLTDFLENRKVPPEYLPFCKTWEKAYFEWEKQQEEEG